MSVFCNPGAWRAGLAVAVIAAGPAFAADPMRFWNLTGQTISSLTLAPAGTTDFGPNQCANDKDGTVDNDERLRLTNVAPGKYDVRIGFQRGQVCMARQVQVRGEGKVAFSLEPHDLKECR